MATSNLNAEYSALERTMNAIRAESKRGAQASLPLPGLEPKRVAGMARDARKVLPERVAELVYDIEARRRLADLVLTDAVQEDLREFIYENANAALLRASSLEPRHTLLLVGPPGNGKTSLAEVLACELSLPLLSVRYDAIVDSFLGETATRLRRIIEHASLNPCVLFFDEFDAVGKERSDVQETGEIKRVVSTLLMQMDRLPSHAIVVCATNHPELLDRAVWRRFELKLEIDKPNKDQLKAWFLSFEKSLKQKITTVDAKSFADYMHGENMSDVEAFTLDVRRKLVLFQGSINASDAVLQVLKRRKQNAKRPLEMEEHGNGIPNNPPRTRAGSSGSAKRKKATVPTEAALRPTGPEAGSSV